MVIPSFEAMLRQLARRPTFCGLGAAGIAFFVLSCQASVSGDANLRMKKDAEQGPEEQPDFNKPAGAKALAGPGGTATTPTFGETALLGARHDMSLVGARASATCACLKVAIGSAPSSAFQWQAAPPHLNDDTQLAIAMTSESMPCKDEPKGSSGASYWGYRISGNDVIVFVEGARAGRPRTVAAIIPKPVADGQVYVAPAKSKLPYGRPLDGKGERCKIGNAATKRTTPFTSGELGDTTFRDANSAPTVDAVE